MLKNKKGFTLIESIITIAIFAILGAMLVTGFSTVIRHMGEAAQIKNSTNRVLSEVEKAGTEESTGSSDVYIEIDGNGAINGKVNLLSKQEKIDDSFTVKLRKFYKGESKEDLTKTFYEKVVAAQKIWEAMSETERKKTYEEAKIKLGLDYNYITGLTNDNFKAYYYAVFANAENYPEMDSEVMKKANNIFDRINPGYPNHTVRLGNKNYYMKPYYLVKSKKIILWAETGPTYKSTDGWRARLIYNPEDGYWYYKVFKALSNQESEDSYYTLARFTGSNVNDIEVWEKLRQSFNDTSQWEKIK